MLNALIGFSLKNRFVVLLAGGHPGRPRRRAGGPAAPGRLPRHHAGAGPDQHGGPGAGPRGGRAADHLPRRVRPGRPEGAARRSAPSPSSGCRRWSRSSRTAPTSTSPGSRSTSGWPRPGCPQGIERPTMGPVATGLGEVYHYLLTSDGYDLTELRTLQDWVIRPRLRRVPGVAEINAWGGCAKQFEVRVDPSEARQARPHARRREPGPPREQPERRRRLRRHAPASRASSRASAGPRRRRDRRGRHRGPGRRARSASATWPRSRIGHVIRRGGRHGRRPGRGRPRPRLHADGRELARRDPGPRRGDGGRPEGPAAGRSTSSRSSTSGPTWSTRCLRPSSGTCSRGRSSSSPSCSPSSATSAPG